MANPIIVNPERIARFTRCPKMFFYGHTEVPREPSSFYLSQTGQLVSSVIKDVYRHISKKGTAPQWQLIIRWTENHYKKLLSIPTSGITKETDFIQIKKLLTLINKWYTQIFPQFKDVAYVNLPVALNFDDKIVYEDYLDVVTIGEQVRIFTFSDTARIGRDLVNNLVFQVRIWGFFRYAEKVPDQIICLSINDTNIVPISIYPVTKTIDKTEGFLRQIFSGMCDGNFYPSYGAECISCPYQTTCTY